MSWAAANRAAQGRRERSYLVVWARPRTSRCDGSQPQPTSEPNPRQDPDVQVRGGVESIISPHRVDAPADGGYPEPVRVRDGRRQTMSTTARSASMRRV